MLDLSKKRIIIGMTGSIACYKIAELTRSITESGISVDIVMTKSSKNFITKTTMQALSGNSVFDDEINNESNNGIRHINLSRKSDLIVIAPASANFISKIALGIADDILSNICLARNCPLIIAPAMNKEMWNNPSTQRNIKLLESDGVKIIGPDYGKQACGEEGYGKLANIEEIFIEIRANLQEKLLEKKKVLITTGPTIEPIDPMRFISNKSSGKTGYSIAIASYEYGADVTLVTGPTNFKIPSFIKTYNVLTAAEMYEYVIDLAKTVDIFISVAAVADWKVKNYTSKKIKKTEKESIPKIELEQNPDILLEVSKMKNKPWCVGFAAETDDIEENAYKKLVNKKLDLVVANNIDNVVGSDYSTFTIIDSFRKLSLPRANKMDNARILVEEISKKFLKK